MVKQISDNEIYVLIKYIKSVLWRVAKRLSYKEDARCLKVNAPTLLKSGSFILLEPSGPVQACNRIALPLPLTKSFPNIHPTKQTHTPIQLLTHSHPPLQYRCYHMHVTVCILLHLCYCMLLLCTLLPAVTVKNCAFPSAVDFYVLFVTADSKCFSVQL